MLEDLERGLLEYEMAGKFLADIKKKFREGNEETVNELTTLYPSL